MKQLYSLAERAKIRAEIIRERVNTIIPELMKRDGVEMWINVIDLSRFLR